MIIVVLLKAVRDVVKEAIKLRRTLLKRYALAE
jgi:hypothetical protein